MNKTKIICTIGPASQSPAKLNEMIKAGMNVARLNFSHGDHKNHALLIKNIRTEARKNKAIVPIIQDLHGPKIRVLKMTKPLDVKIGQQVIIGQDFFLDTNVMKSVKPGQKILIEDGLIELETTKIIGKKIYCVVLSPGKILENKGVNLPRTKLKIPILTPRDIDDLKFGLKMDVDFIALSFVRTANDIKKLRALIKQYLPKNLSSPKIIAKIEKPEAVKNFDAILKETDAIMVARGDLGVEMPENEVPIIQKCVTAAKPVIVATQMLDSMIRNPRPTRAEVSDVANAVIDQTDCVMLSGETAFGKYPVKAVAEMAKIIETTEKSVFLPAHSHLEKTSTASEAISESVFHLAIHTKAQAIIGATESGFTARQISKERLYKQKLIMFTKNPKTLLQISLAWGIQGILMPKFKNFEDLVKTIMQTVKQKKIVKKGGKIILVTGEPLGQKENLNLLEIKTVN